jgi:GNAT superfamily N-acetyltransferase
VFAPPAAALGVRAAFFGLTGRCHRAALAALNEQLWVLRRVVLHPAYRGAGVAAAFVRRACELCPVDWVETLAAMGHANPVFERAGFTRVGVVRRSSGGVDPRRRGAYGGRPRPAARTSRSGDPVYYVFDNRGRGAKPGPCG